MLLSRTLCNDNGRAFSRLSVQFSRVHKAENSKNLTQDIICCSPSISGPTNRRLEVHTQASCNVLRGNLRHFSSSPARSKSFESYPIIHSKEFDHWFKNWHDKRKDKLTASTFSGAIGFWPHRRIQLWKEKVGLLPPFTRNLAVCWSNMKEEIAIEQYKLITGNTVFFPQFQPYNKSNPEDDWLAASPDGLMEHVACGLPFGGILEVKCPFFNGETRRAFPWSRLPLHCMPQAQGLLEIMDRDWMDLYCWTPNGSSLFRINRDRQYWELLHFALSDFWMKHVKPAKNCLKHASGEMLEVVEQFKPHPRHELCPSIVRASKQLVDESTLLVREVRGRFEH